MFGFIFFFFLLLFYFMTKAHSHLTRKPTNSEFCVYFCYLYMYTQPSVYRIFHLKFIVYCLLLCVLFFVCKLYSVYVYCIDITPINKGLSDYCLSYLIDPWFQSCFDIYMCIVYYFGFLYQIYTIVYA